MNLFECVILGISSLKRNPLRSALTILGIIVRCRLRRQYGICRRRVKRDGLERN